MILNLFSSRPDHPLADPKELRRILAEIPLDDSFRAVDEISDWLESLMLADGVRVDLSFDIVRRLDEAAQPHLRRLAREYLNSPRLSRAEEKRLWTANHGYWARLADCCDHCLTRAAAREKGADALKPALPLLAARALAATGQQMKWIALCYGPVPNALWQRLGHAYLIAEAAHVATRPVQLYPNASASVTAAQLYLRALVFQASAVDSLLPYEIELADLLAAHFISDFEFGADAQVHSVYWVDAAQPTAPMRLARLPAQLTASLRFFSPGRVPQGLDALIHVVERGEVPESLNLGNPYLPRTLLPVLRHLALQWAPQPPLREHQRHRVKTRLSVLNGFNDCFTVFAGHVARAGKEHAAERWLVENVSLGGFGAMIGESLPDWLTVGVLIAMQPEGGANWVLGIVRRFARERGSRAAVGIQTLARQAVSLELRPRGRLYAAAAAIPGIRLAEDRAPGELRLVLPRASFDLRENLEYVQGGRRRLLSPIELVETGGDFEITRYREIVED